MQTTFDVDTSIDNKKFIERMCQRGLKAKGVVDDEWYQEQLKYELGVIFDCGLENFFFEYSLYTRLLGR